ncbi:leucyl/phenylalanyl-tRNA--protein transferase [Luteitalea sp.]|uniref:leucyl/phenylalanyl-tRNA--protein transferase n=1 Tax=Luteitalea sp. TaxID=2004800 RepID=UPI000AE9B044|nr:leucyl/phenylalanyl-tRNA--protein transferase [Luteitalea sp.]
MRSRARQTIDPDLLLRAYSLGWFPMGTGRRGRIEWFSPDPRGIIPLDTFHAPSRLARVVRQSKFDLRIDTAFESVMRACAERDETWITDDIVAAYVSLHRLGCAHSVETWQGGVLVGGLYGVSLGGAFFGESMFHTATDASKVALVALVERLRARGFVLLDTQWVTPHLQQFGATEIRRSAYLDRLAAALPLECRFDGA